jgi:hypothetical protein
MPTRQEYLRYADECIALAQNSTDPETRMRLLEMAQAWRELAVVIINARGYLVAKVKATISLSLFR